MTADSVSIFLFQSKFGRTIAKEKEEKEKTKQKQRQSTTGQWVLVLPQTQAKNQGKAIPV
jgi:hypothetical protein